MNFVIVLVGKYKKIFPKQGVLHLKTDSRELYDYLKEVAPEQGWEIEADVFDVYQDAQNTILTEINTFYEKIWLKEEKVISYLRLLINK